MRSYFTFYMSCYTFCAVLAGGMFMQSRFAMFAFCIAWAFVFQVRILREVRIAILAGSWL